jgi:phosphocarrier protein HPr
MSPMSRVCATAKIVNKLGLHARASAKLVDAASRFKSHVTIGKDGQCVDARSVMGLLLLIAPIGTEVEISAAGEDAQEALNAILALIAAKFGEE